MKATFDVNEVAQILRWTQRMRDAGTNPQAQKEAADEAIFESREAGIDLMAVLKATSELFAAEVQTSVKESENTRRLMILFAYAEFKDPGVERLGDAIKWLKAHGINSVDDLPAGDPDTIKAHQMADAAGQAIPDGLH